MHTRQYGLLGKNISYSFSKAYFAKKFEKEALNHCIYENFDLENIFEITAVLKKNRNLKGLNVTIPYKETVIPFLDKISKNASKIGAVNTIKISKKGVLKGYNTDFYGFKKVLKPLLQPHHQKALILGTGGASKAIAFALKKLNIDFKYVSRSPLKNGLLYDQLDATIIEEHPIIINCTPLGTSPKINECPLIPYQFLGSKHLVFDLIYNPEKTLFLQNAAQQGAEIQNGLQMLEFQAEKAWEIWNS